MASKQVTLAGSSDWLGTYPSQGNDVNGNEYWQLDATHLLFYVVPSSRYVLYSILAPNSAASYLSSAYFNGSGLTPPDPNGTYSANVGSSPDALISDAASAPSAPSAPGLTPVSATAIDVAVQALSGGATSYDLQRAPDVLGSPGTYATIQSSVTPSTTYHDTGLLALTGYWYRLVGVNGSGSTNGTGAEANTLPSAPAAPSALTVTPISNTAVDVAVQALSGGATSYDLQRAPDSSGSPGAWATIQASVTPSATFHNTGLTANTRYWYRLVATNTGGSTNGSSASGTTFPVAPSALVLDPISGTAIDVTIPALSGGAVTYNLQRAPDVTGSPGSWATIGTAVTPSSTVHDTGLTVNTTYWYRLVAVGAGGSTNGTAASEITFAAAPAAPVLAITYDVDVTIPALSGGAASYNLYRDGSLIATSVMPSSTYSDDNVAVGTHTYQISAVDADGDITMGASAVVKVGPASGGGGGGYYY